MLQLRDYQVEASAKAVEFFRSTNKKDRPIIVAPTGSGKSVVIADIAHTVGATLVLQPSKELLEQNYEKFKLYGGDASIYSASMGVKEVGDVTFATIGSLKDKGSEFAHVKHILIDECHLLPPQEDVFDKHGVMQKKGSMFMKFLASIPEAKVIGLTASPFRLKKYRDPFSGDPFAQINLLMRERPKFFNDFLHVTQIGELYDKGFLCPVRYIELIWDNGDLKPNTTGAEYSEQSVDFALKQQKIHERLPEIIQQSVEKGRKHNLVFVIDVAHALELAAKVPDSACVHALTPKKERAQIIEGFKSGKIKTVFNVGVLTTGFDFPALDTVIIARPTLSLALFMQMVGRGIRLFPGKDECVVLDMCGNVKRFSTLDKLVFEKNVKGLWQLRDDKRLLSGVRMA